VATSKRSTITPLISPDKKDKGVLVRRYFTNEDIGNSTTYLALDTAQELWKLLLPAGFKGGALIWRPSQDRDGDVKMDDGWKEEYNTWWLDFMAKKGGKGVSKDTWQMVRAALSLNVVMLKLPSSSTLSVQRTPNSRTMTQRVSR